MRKVILVFIYVLILSVVMGKNVFADIPTGTVVLGDRAYSLEYANNISNFEEINNAVVNSEGKVYIKDFSGKWINNNTFKSINVNLLPKLIYKNEEGKIITYAEHDGDEILDENEEIIKGEVIFSQANYTLGEDDYDVEIKVKSQAFLNVIDTSKIKKLKVEILNYTIEGNPIHYTTIADSNTEYRSTSVNVPSNDWITFTIPRELLREGDNTITVYSSASYLSSSNMFYDISFYGTCVVTKYEPETKGGHLKADINILDTELTDKQWGIYKEDIVKITSEIVIVDDKNHEVYLNPYEVDFIYRIAFEDDYDASDKYILCDSNGNPLSNQSISSINDETFYVKFLERGKYTIELEGNIKSAQYSNVKVSMSFWVKE